MSFANLTISLFFFPVLPSLLLEALSSAKTFLNHFKIVIQPIVSLHPTKSSILPPFFLLKIYNTPCQTDRIYLPKLLLIDIYLIKDICIFYFLTCWLLLFFLPTQNTFHSSAHFPSPSVAFTGLPVICYSSNLRV